MASPSLISSAKGGTSGSTTGTLPAFSVTAGQTVLAFASDTDGNSCSCAGSVGGSYTLVGQIGGFNPRIWVFAKTAHPGGTETLTFTFGSAADAALSRAVFSPCTVDTGSLVMANTGSNPFVTTTNTLASANSTVILMGSCDAGGTVGYSESTGFTKIQDQNDGNTYWSHCTWQLPVSATTAVSSSMTAGPGGTTNAKRAIFALTETGGSTDTPVSPAQATVTTSGPAPTISRTANQSVTPAQAAVAITGQAPTIARTAGTSVSPGQAAIAVAGQVPTVARTANQAVSPAAATVALAGPAPTVARTANQAVSPGAAGETLQGFAPTIGQQANTGVSPAAGTMALQGFVPTVAATANQSVAPGTGALAFAGPAPAIVNSSTPPAPTGLPGLDYEAAPSTSPRRAKFVSVKPPLQAALERRFPDPEEGEPTYSQMRVDDATGALIRAWAAARGFQTVTDDLHVTLAYSREPVDLSGVQLLDGFAVPRTGRGLDQFGDAVVLTLTSARLTEQWQAIRDAGASWDFPEYQPHITITYEKGDVELAEVRPYTGPIVLLDEERSALESGFDADESPVDAGAAGIASPQIEQLTPAKVELLAEKWRATTARAPISPRQDAQLQNQPAVQAQKQAQDDQAAQLAEMQRRAKARADDEEAIARAVALLF